MVSNDGDLLEIRRSWSGIPRVIGYPLFIIVPVCAFVAGIILGEAPGTSALAVWPNPTPAGNWVLFLIAVGIGLVMFVDSGLKRDDFRVRPTPAILYSVALILILLAGITGLFIGLAYMVLLSIANRFFAARLANLTGNVDKLFLTHSVARLWRYGCPRYESCRAELTDLDDGKLSCAVHGDVYQVDSDGVGVLTLLSNEKEPEIQSHFFTFCPHCDATGSVYWNVMRVGLNVGKCRRCGAAM